MVPVAAAGTNMAEARDILQADGCVCVVINTIATYGVHTWDEVRRFPFPIIPRGTTRMPSSHSDSAFATAITPEIWLFCMYSQHLF